MHGIKPNTHLSTSKSNHDADDEFDIKARFTRDIKPQYDPTKSLKHTSGNLLAEIEKQILDWHNERNTLKNNQVSEE